MIEFRPTPTHQHFVTPYERTTNASLKVVETDLREWDWLAQSSRPVRELERRNILNEMQAALLSAGTTMTILLTRPSRSAISKPTTLANVATFLQFLAQLFRDGGNDEPADLALYASMQYSEANTISGDFRKLAFDTLHELVNNYGMLVPTTYLPLARAALDYCKF